MQWLDISLHFTYSNYSIKKFDDFIGLLSKFEYEDYLQTKTVDCKTAHRIVKSFRIPISEDNLKVKIGRLVKYCIRHLFMGQAHSLKTFNNFVMPISF